LGEEFVHSLDGRGRLRLDGLLDDAAGEAMHTIIIIEYTHSSLTQHTDGHSYRFTMWPKWDGATLSPVWAEVRAIELYNHSIASMAKSEFDAFENVNIANGGVPYWQASATNTNPLVSIFTPLLKKSFGFV
jgi:hypothetical protein